MAGVPSVQPPPVQAAALDTDHPDFYIPEVVKGFLPFFHRQITEKVRIELYMLTYTRGALFMPLTIIAHAHTRTCTHSHTYVPPIQRTLQKY